MPVIALAFFAAGTTLTLLASQKTQKNGFYTLTPLLSPLGIYVWGDALILGPFWLLSGLIFYFLSPTNTLRYLLLFHALRSSFEVIYWLNHQAVKDPYRPPALKLFQQLDTNALAILYQLLHFTITFLTLAALIYTFI